MCGIAGFIDPCAREEAIAHVRAKEMADTLAHRGPDAVGVWVSVTDGIGLVHRRLAVVDLSPEGSQPRISSCGTIIVTYNGELYNTQELRDKLARVGRLVSSRSDTEVLVECCAEWGVKKTLEQLNGMFAFAVWDKQRRVLTLARDHVGIKPLYWMHHENRFLFGSELCALTCFPDIPFDIDRDSLAAYFRYRHVPAPYSIFRNVFKLGAGCFLTLPLGGCPVIERYWDSRRVIRECITNRTKMDEVEVIEELERLVADSVRRQMHSDVPLGSFLSGGIDSGVVTALAQSASTSPLKTYAIGFHEAEFDEAPHARILADHLGTDHTDLYVGPKETMEIIPELARCFDEPFAGNSQIPSLIVSKLARRDVTVALGGDGGDELFGGYPRYFEFPAAVEAALQGHVSGMTRHREEDEHYRRLISTRENPLAVVLGARERSDALMDHTLAEFIPNFTERMGYFDFVSTLSDDILAKVDRVSMAFGLEVRVPLLDRRLIEFSWKLPNHLKYSNQHESKRLLRQLLYRYVTPDLVDRPKKSFVAPVSSWLKGPLRQWAEQLLNENSLAIDSLIDMKLIQSRWKSHAAGHHNHGRLLWCVLMFGEWLHHQKNFVRSR